MATIGYRFSQYRSLHMPGAVQNVNPLMRVMWMNTDFFTFLKPSIYLVSVEGDIGAQVE